MRAEHTHVAEFGKSPDSDSIGVEGGGLKLCQVRCLVTGAAGPHAASVRQVSDRCRAVHTPFLYLTPLL